MTKSETKTKVVKIGKDTLIFKSENDFAKLCFINSFDEIPLTAVVIVDKKHNLAAKVELNKDDITKKSLDWFYSQAQLYNNITKGTKAKAVIMNIDGQYWYFVNRANYGKLCYLVRKDNNIGGMTPENLKRFAEPVEVDKNGNLIAVDITDWKQNHFDAEYRRIKHIDGILKVIAA